MGQVSGSPDRNRDRPSGPITVGDIIKTVDNTPYNVPRFRTGGIQTVSRPKKHRRVIVHVDATQAYLVPIFSDLPTQQAAGSMSRPARPSSVVLACKLKPSDMACGVLDHCSYMAYDQVAKRSLPELQSEIDIGRLIKLPRCPAPTLLRILSGLKSAATEMPDSFRRELGLSSAVRNILPAIYPHI